MYSKFLNFLFISTNTNSNTNKKELNDNKS